MLYIKHLQYRKSIPHGKFEDNKRKKRRKENQREENKEKKILILRKLNEKHISKRILI